MQRTQGVEQPFTPVMAEIMPAKRQRLSHDQLVSLPEKRDEVANVLEHVRQVLRDGGRDGRVAVAHILVECVQEDIPLAQQARQAVSQVVVHRLRHGCLQLGLLVGLERGQQGRLQVEQGQ